jgi:uncharacterized protein (TIGR03437 family)
MPAPALQFSDCLYNRDFPLISIAGANTVRTYGRIGAGERTLWQALERNNLYLLAGFPLDPYYDPTATLAATTDTGHALRAKILSDFRQYAQQFQNKKRLVALVFGNEVGINYSQKFGGSPHDFYSLVNDAAAALQADFGSAAPLLTTAVADVTHINQATLATRDADLPGLSFWSVNAYRGTTFNGLFDDLRQKTGKAVLISELGVDAWDSVRGAEDAGAQAAGLRNLTEQLQQEMGRASSTVIGGVWFSWSDEWWKGGPDPSTHGAAGVPAPGFPDGVNNGAWFGLFGVSATDAPGLDSLRSRPAFAALAAEWGGVLPQVWPPSKTPSLSPQGVVNAGSLEPSVAPGSLASFFGQDLTANSASSLDSPLPFQMDLTSACVASLPVPLLFAGPGQINGEIPWEAPVATASALVYRAGVASNVVPVDVHSVSPGILDHGVIPSGKPCPVSVTNGVRPGTYLEIYGTGLGGATSAGSGGVVSGVAPLAPLPIDSPPRSFLESRELRVLYSGLVPGMVGLYQTNTQVPADFPPGVPLNLRLSAGGVDSNPYPIAVLSDSDQPQFTLNSSALTFVVQAGGPPQTAMMTLGGQNGFCELVRFSITGMPDGVSVSLPVGFPGQPVPVTVQSSSQARGAQDVIAAIQSFSSAVQNPGALLHVTVLPSRGDIPFRVTSGGGHAGLIARFEMAGRVMYEAHGGGIGRGFNFLTLNGSTGVLGPPRNFDTWLSEQASEAMADYLTGLPAGTVVLGAIADEGTLHLTARGRAALRQVLGTQLTDGIKYQDSWAIIARVGAPVPIAEDAASDRQAVLDKVLTFPMP